MAEIVVYALLRQNQPVVGQFELRYTGADAMP